VSEGKLNKTAAEVVSRFKGSYIETSSSGTGLRIFCFGKPGRCGKGTELKWIEVYDYTSSRYLTVTGLWWEGTSRVVTPQQQALDWLYEQYFKPKEASKSKAKDSGLTLSLGKQEIIEKAKTARNGGKFSALFYGEWQAAGYPSQSEADAALCSMLAFWTQDEGQIDWIFRQSALMRKKWDERHDASGKTYGGDDDPQCPRYSGRDLPRRR
jgi:primase-polymerase (primpol)-like protein